MPYVWLLLLVIILFGCSGCATDGGAKPEPRVIVQRVEVPVPVACVPESLSPAPSYPDTDEALRSAGPERALPLILAGRDQRTKRLNDLEPVITHCRKAKTQ